MVTSVSAYNSQSISQPTDPPQGPGPMIIRCTIPQADLAATVTGLPVAGTNFIEVSLAAIVQQNPGFVPQSFSMENRNCVDMAIFIRNGIWVQRFVVKPGQRIYRSIDVVTNSNMVFDVSLQPQGMIVGGATGGSPPNWQVLAVSDVPINFYNYPQRHRDENLWQWYNQYGFFVSGIQLGRMFTLPNNITNGYKQTPLLRVSYLYYNATTTAVGGTGVSIKTPISNANLGWEIFVGAGTATPSWTIQQATLLDKGSKDEVNAIIPPGFNLTMDSSAAFSGGSMTVNIAAEILWPVQADNNFSSYLASF
jgi:hypothetical protein